MMCAMFAGESIATTYLVAMFTATFAVTCYMLRAGGHVRDLDVNNSISKRPSARRRGSNA